MFTLLFHLYFMSCLFFFSLLNSLLVSSSVFATCLCPVLLISSSCICLCYSCLFLYKMQFNFRCVMIIKFIFLFNHCFLPPFHVSFSVIFCFVIFFLNFSSHFFPCFLFYTISCFCVLCMLFQFTFSSFFSL